MEDFLEGLNGIIDAHCESMSIIELIGALQITQQRLAVDMLLNDEEDDAEA